MGRAKGISANAQTEGFDKALGSGRGTHHMKNSQVRLNDAITNTLEAEAAFKYSWDNHEDVHAQVFYDGAVQLQEAVKALDKALTSHRGHGFIEEDIQLESSNDGFAEEYDLYEANLFGLSVGGLFMRRERFPGREANGNAPAKPEGDLGWEYIASNFLTFAGETEIDFHSVVTDREHPERHLTDDEYISWLISPSVSKSAYKKTREHLLGRLRRRLTSSVDDLLDDKDLKSLGRKPVHNK